MKYGLIGEKLGHSFSKPIHEKLAGYTYDITPLSREEFHEFMVKKDFCAINVTIPYKIDVIPYLQDIHQNAKDIGAVNTIVNNAGKLCGYNTDFSGFLYLILKNNIEIKGKKILILGKGGAAKAIIAVMKHLDAKEIITVYYKESSDTVTIEESLKNHSDGQVIINTTPVGMYPNIDKSPIDLTPYKNCEAVIDAIYNPLKTALLIQAEDLHIKAVGGLEMLIAQAKYAVEIFQDKKLENDCIDLIYKGILKDRKNIVLIGMPSCGKTTVGKEIARLLERPFIDIDIEIIKRINMPISDYFEKCGEEKFRELETQVTKELSAKTGMVISTGGGCVKKKENIDALRKNGIIIFIKRELNALIIDPERPLSKNYEAIKKMYKERYHLYKSYSQKTISNNRDIEKTIQKIIKAYYELI